MPLSHESRDSIAAYSDDSSSESVCIGIDSIDSIKSTNADQALLKEAFGGSVHRRKEVARAWRIERQNDSFQTEKKTTASCAATTSEHSHTRNIGGLYRKLHITKKWTILYLSALFIYDSGLWNDIEIVACFLSLVIAQLWFSSSFTHSGMIMSEWWQCPALACQLMPANAGPIAKQFNPWAASSLNLMITLCLVTPPAYFRHWPVAWSELVERTAHGANAITRGCPQQPPLLQ